MARIRYMKPDFFKDDDLGKLPFETRLLFAGLWGIADKAGRLEDRPLRIKAEIFPYDNVDIIKNLDLLAQPKQSSGDPFIKRYTVDGQGFIQIIKWKKHQKPHHTEKESIFPPVPPSGDGDGVLSIENGKPDQTECGVTEPVNTGEIPVKGKRFIPPSLEDVKKYIQDNPELNNVDPETFFKGFNDSGWIDTKGNPVRNWKLKLRTWSSYGQSGTDQSGNSQKAGGTWKRHARDDFPKSSAYGKTINV